MDKNNGERLHERELLM